MARGHAAAILLAGASGAIDSWQSAVGRLAAGPALVLRGMLSSVAAQAGAVASLCNAPPEVDPADRLDLQRFDARQDLAFHPFQESPASCRDEGEVDGDAGGVEGGDGVAAAGDGG